jgi:hypothetical protein
VEDVAAKLNTSQKAIASALKQHENTNFNTFTNPFVAYEAKRIMENPSDGFYKSRRWLLIRVLIPDRFFILLLNGLR